MFTVKTAFNITVNWGDVIDVFTIPFVSLEEANQWVKDQQVEHCATIETTKFIQFYDNTGSFYTLMNQRHLAEEYLTDHPCSSAICNATTESFYNDYVDFELAPYHERDDKGVYTFSSTWEKVYV